jgi:hypothetical protein
MISAAITCNRCADKTILKRTGFLLSHFQLPGQSRRRRSEEIHGSILVIEDEKVRGLIKMVLTYLHQWNCWDGEGIRRLLCGFDGDHRYLIPS